MNAPAKPRGWTRRALLLTTIALFAWLLWPLSTREWVIEGIDEESPAKKRYLESERSLGPRRGAPRVVLIVADDLARTDVGLYGASIGAAPVPTPAIDSIGHDGAVFSQASATATICAPSRAAILTGRYPQRYGFALQPHNRYARNRLEYLGFRYVVDTDPMMPVSGYGVPPRSELKHQGLPAGQITLAELLKARGYATAAVGKWHLGYDEQFSPLRRGFDEHYGFYEAFSLYSPIGTPGIVDTPIDDFSDQHMWSQGRQGASAIVRNDIEVEEQEYLTFRFAEEASDYIKKHADEPFFLYVPFSAPHTPLQAPEEYVAALDHIDNAIRRTYAAMIATLDDAVEQILNALEQSGIAEETMVIFTSDNGGTSYLGVTDNGPLAGGKFTTYEGGIAVPLMIRYPELFEPGTIVSPPVSLLDIFSTVDEATRSEGDSTALSRPSELDLDGIDLVAAAAAPEETLGDRTLFWGWAYNKAVRAGPWKLVVTEDGSPDVPVGERRVELYDLGKDPGEREDVSDEHPDIVADLLARLRDWESELHPPLWPPVMHFYHDIWGNKRWFGI